MYFWEVKRLIRLTRELGLGLIVAGSIVLIFKLICDASIERARIENEGLRERLGIHDNRVPHD